MYLYHGYQFGTYESHDDVSLKRQVIGIKMCCCPFAFTRVLFLAQTVVEVRGNRRFKIVHFDWFFQNVNKCLPHTLDFDWLLQNVNKCLPAGRRTHS